MILIRTDHPCLMVGCRNDATLLIECSVVDDKTRHVHIIEDIICYSYPLLLYCIGFYLSRSHMWGIGSHFNYLILSYKRFGQTLVLKTSFRLF
jgi:hypothetical protein